MIKPVLFIDFNGTICFDHFWRSADDHIRDVAKQLLFSDDAALVHDWMVGKYQSEDINAMIADQINIDKDVLWNIFVSDCQNMVVDPSALECIQSLRSKFTTVLATDNMDCFDRFTVPALHLDRYFDSIVNSCRHNLLKDDGLFEKIAAFLPVTWDQAILIDDSESTCVTFEQLGGRACRVKTPQCTLSFLQQLAA